jgi:hypothetical protein
MNKIIATAFLAIAVATGLVTAFGIVDPFNLQQSEQQYVDADSGAVQSPGFYFTPLGAHRR